MTMASKSNSIRRRIGAKSTRDKSSLSPGSIMNLQNTERKNAVELDHPDLDFLDYDYLKVDEQDYAAVDAKKNADSRFETQQHPSIEIEKSEISDKNSLTTLEKECSDFDVIPNHTTHRGENSEVLEIPESENFSRCPICDTSLPKRVIEGDTSYCDSCETQRPVEQSDDAPAPNGQIDFGLNDENSVSHLTSEAMGEVEAHEIQDDDSNTYVSEIDDFLTRDEPQYDWELYINEDLEEENFGNDQEHDESDDELLENATIARYASQLLAYAPVYKVNQIRKCYARFFDALSNFPHHNNYREIKKLLECGHTSEHVADVCAIKLIWASNQYLWTRRTYYKNIREWSIVTAENLKNSLSWKVASDLVIGYGKSDLENLIMSDWYSEWTSIPLYPYLRYNLQPDFFTYSEYVKLKHKLLEEEGGAATA